LHWRAKRWGFSKGGYDMCLENIFISFFLKTFFFDFCLFVYLCLCL
jgi:hypothetical protein